MNRRKFYNILRWAVTIYVASGIAIYFLSERILFRPKALPANYVFHLDQKFNEGFFNTGDARIHYLKFFPAGPSKGIVLYFHGNRKNILHYADRVKEFTVKGYEVWMPDYPRFGKSTGSLTEEVLYNTAAVLYRMANSEKAAEQIIIYGRSIGSGVAAQLAAVRSCKAVVLETPYYSMSSLARRYFPIYPAVVVQKFSFPVYDYLQTTTAPIFILHGTADWVVPYGQAHELKKSLPQINLVTLPGGSHNNLNTFPVYHQTLTLILQ